MSIDDTAPEARRVQMELYRRMSPARKLELVFNAYEFGKALAMAGIRMRNPGATEEQVWRIWAKRHLGTQLYNEVYGASESD